MARPFGVYVHFPYCVHRCPYCDFAVTTERPPAGGRYARAVRAELALRAGAFDELDARSLYLGGGTPSLWEPAEVSEVVSAIRNRVALPPDAEVTIEANPESCDAGRLRAWRDAGVNRVSIGVQSFDPGVLAKLGRRHGPEEAERAIRAAAAIVGNVSVDLIHGGRRSSPGIAAADAACAVAAGAVHVSAYALTLDPEVLAEEVPLARLARSGRVAFPDAEEVGRQGAAIRAALRRAGLRRYEVSNFARPGFESVHNGLYWAGESYLGLGAGAYGCLHHADGATRYGNLRDAEAWLAAVEAGRLPVAEEDRIGRAAERNEQVMLALRTTAGVALEGIGPARRPEVDALVRHRFAVRRGGRLVLTSRGMDLHSSISERLFE